MNSIRKKAHGGPEKRYGRWSAVAIEQQGYVAAINTPEWGIDQICECMPSSGSRSLELTGVMIIDSPKRPFEWSTTYKFSSMH
jgi:aldose 1-epimerase